MYTNCKTTNKARISKYGSGAEKDKYSAETDKSGAELDETTGPKKKCRNSWQPEK